MPLVVTKISRGSTLSHRVELLRRKLHGLDEDDPDDYNHAAAWDLNVEIADLLKDEEEEYERAVRHYKKALSHAAQDKAHRIDYRGRADVLNSLSICCQRIGEFTEAFRFGQEHLKLAESFTDLWEQVKAHQSLGDTFLHEGESIEDESQAVAVFKHASKQYEACKALIAKLQAEPISDDPSQEQLQTQILFMRLNSGIIYTKLKMFHEAKLDLATALTLCKDLGDIDNERNIYMNMAALAEASGDLDNVTRHQQVELDFVRKYNLEGEMDCMLDMARVYRLRGMNDECVKTCRAIQELSSDPDTTELAEEHIREVMEEAGSGNQDSASISQLQDPLSSEEYPAGLHRMNIDDFEQEASFRTESSTPNHVDDVIQEDHAPRKRLFQKGKPTSHTPLDEMTCEVSLDVDPSVDVVDLYRFGFQLLEPLTVTFQRIDFNNVGWLKRTIQRRIEDKHFLRLKVDSVMITSSKEPLLDTELLETAIKDQGAITMVVKGPEYKAMTEIYKESCHKMAVYPQELMVSTLASIETTADFRFSNPTLREYVPIFHALLQGPSSLTTINLSNGALDDSAVDLLAQVLYSPVLKHLALASNKLSGNGLRRILSPRPLSHDAKQPSWFTRLPKSTLETLDLSFNPLGGNSGLEYIARCIDRFPALKKLDLMCCNLSLTTMSAAMEDWERIEQLQSTLHRGLELSIARNSFSTEGMLLWLQRASPNVVCVDSLDISSMHVGEGWSGLSFLSGIVRLRRLVLNNCDIGHIGVRSLSMLLKKSVFLETLELRHAQLDNRAVAILSEGIAANTSLRSLDVSGNSLGSNTAPTATVSISSNQEPHNDSLHRPGTFHLAAALRRHMEGGISGLTQLTLASCQLRLQDCTPLFHTNLQNLVLAQNPLLETPEDFDQLMSLVAPLTTRGSDTGDNPPSPMTLRKLDLSWTFSSAVSSSSAQTQDVSTKIQDLVVSWQTDPRHLGSLGPGSSVQGPILVLVANPLRADNSRDDMDVDP